MSPKSTSSNSALFYSVTAGVLNRKAGEISENPEYNENAKRFGNCKPLRK